MADQAAVKSSTPYVSEHPESDFQRFKDTLRRVVSVPKETVDKAIAKEIDQRQQVKKGKNG